MISFYMHHIRNLGGNAILEIYHNNDTYSISNKVLHFLQEISNLFHRCGRKVKRQNNYGQNNFDFNYFVKFKAE